MMQDIKVFHEVPFELLYINRDYTDGDYCLPHLLDESEYYRDYFYDAKKQGRYIIMDNSLHELGSAYNTERLMYWINELKPNEFIVPDVWEDKNKSIQNARSWSTVNLPDGVTKVAVVQAKSIGEAIECTQTYFDLGYKKIAYSYGASYYNDVCPHPNKDLGKALGRLQVISTLYNMKLLLPTSRVHLLGTCIPQEFGWYKGIECIESIDTSNPMMAAIEGTQYEFYGLYSKPKVNMNQAQGMPIKRIDMELYYNNINLFRLINNLKQKPCQKK
jgi:hypothetical protein